MNNTTATDATLPALTHNEDTAAAQPGPRRRKSRKRTKTGCLTCRKRRIKCGEERPICQNCVKSKRHCEGYHQRVPFKSSITQYQQLQNGAASITFHASALGMDSDLLSQARRPTAAPGSGYSELRPRPPQVAFVQSSPMFSQTHQGLLPVMPQSANFSRAASSGQPQNAVFQHLPVWSTDPHPQAQAHRVSPGLPTPDAWQLARHQEDLRPTPTFSQPVPPGYSSPQTDPYAWPSPALMRHGSMRPRTSQTSHLSASVHGSTPDSGMFVNQCPQMLPVEQFPDSDSSMYGNATPRKSLDRRSAPGLDTSGTLGVLRPRNRLCPSICLLRATLMNNRADTCRPSSLRK